MSMDAKMAANQEFFRCPLPPDIVGVMIMGGVVFWDAGSLVVVVVSKGGSTDDSGMFWKLF